MSNKSDPDFDVGEVWRHYLTTGDIPDYVPSNWYHAKWLRPWLRRLPADPRCRTCYVPFEGLGGSIARHGLGIIRSKLNPGMCNICETFAQEYKGGTELELSMVFADVRGSTTLAEGMSPAEFSRLINRFYKAASSVLFDTNAMVEKLIGDEVAGLYVPGFAGPDHARVAIDAARSILEATGHGEPSGPWIPVGAGVHTGTAFVGAVSSSGVTDITALGDAVNAAARLASEAGAGEVVVSEDARVAAKWDTAGLEDRHLQLKGRREPVDVWVIKVPAGQHSSNSKS